MSARILANDLFSGGGGFSAALEHAAEELGLDLDYTAINHWATAIATHERNHPRAKHLRANMYRVSTREAASSGRLDILVASPTCTFHSRARGAKPISPDQKYGRMTPTQVVRWCRELDVATLVVENVPEFVDWTTVHPSPPVEARCVRAGCEPGRPCRSRRGMHFRAWIRRLERLGYRCEWRVLNAADYGDATTRRRFFLMGRKDGLPIVWPRTTHSKTGGRDLFGLLERWRGAREVIDWSLRGKSIFCRKKPLARPTLLRIRAGIVAQRWPSVFVEMVDAHLRGESVQHWLPPAPSPLVVGNRTGNAARGTGEPLPTTTATTVTSGGNHIGLVEPFIAGAHGDKAGAHDRSTRRTRAIDEPIGALHAGGNNFAVVEPFVLSQASGGAARPTGAPIPTTPTRGAHELIVPYHGTGVATTPDAPLGANGERPGQTPRFRPASEPMPTACATGRIPLVQGVAAPRAYYDILLRMLEPEECARAMGFPDNYVFVGNKGERMQQVGNAVARRVAQALIREQLRPFAAARAKERVA